MKGVYSFGRFLRRTMFKNPRFLKIDNGDWKVEAGDKGMTGVCVIADVVFMWWGLPLVRLLRLSALGVVKVLVLCLQPRAHPRSAV